MSRRSRLARVASLSAKRPAGLRVHVRTADSPRPEDRERLLHLLLELLDERAADGRG